MRRDEPGAMSLTAASEDEKILVMSLFKDAIIISHYFS
jgi:hypothetical protein